MSHSRNDSPAPDSGRSPLLPEGTFPPVSYQDWRSAVEAALGGTPFEKRLHTRTHDGVEIRPLYVRSDLPPGPDPSGFPGLPPFVRDSRLLGNAVAGWLSCQHYREALPETVAAAIRRDRRHGVRGVWVECDAATRRGTAPGDAEAAELCGIGGMSLASVGDIETILAAADPETTALYIDAGASAPAAAALLAAAAREGLSKLEGGIVYDPIGILARDGRLPWNADQAFAVAADLAAWAAADAPRLTTLAISAGPYHDAGAGPAEELGCAIAAAIDSLRRMERAGVEPEAAAQRLLFDFPIGRDFFPSIARLRAARLLWDHVRAACGIGETAGQMRIHARTSSFTKTRRDPWVNMVRSTVEAFAAAVGGADSIAVSPFDEAIGEPEELGRRIAANTHLILMEESHVHHFVDPGGGSYFIERLTEEMAARAWDLVREIERQGGMLEALRRGMVQARLRETAQTRRTAIARRRDAVTGVSIYPDLNEQKVERRRPDPGELASRRAAELSGQSSTGNAPWKVPASKPGGEPEVIRSAARAAARGATLAVLSRALAGEAGTEADPLIPWREAEDFETLRDASEAFARRTGHPPRVFLANLGPMARHKARADFTRNLLAAGGIEAIDRGGFDDPEEAARAFTESGARAAAICGTDDSYVDAVPRLAPLLRRAGARRVLLAGRPAEHETAWREAGVDTFAYLGCDALDVLRDLLVALEVLE